MKKKFAFLFVLLLCVSCLSACVSGGAEGTDDGSVSIEDTEDVAIDKGIVTLANMMGKDAVELYARVSGTKEWSKTILSDDSLPAYVATEFTYSCGKTNNNVFDVKLVFEDGTSQEFTNLDFGAAASSTIYLGIEN